MFGIELAEAAPAAEAAAPAAAAPKPRGRPRKAVPVEAAPRTPIVIPELKLPAKRPGRRADVAASIASAPVKGKRGKSGIAAQDAGASQNVSSLDTVAVVAAAPAVTPVKSPRGPRKAALKNSRKDVGLPAPVAARRSKKPAKAPKKPGARKM